MYFYNKYFCMNIFYICGMIRYIEINKKYKNIKSNGRVY